jgi:transcription initiation factor TFIIH subunit 4
MIGVLRFLLKLGSLQFTRGYLIGQLTKVQHSLLKPFRSLGLLYYGRKDAPEGYYFPTRVVLNFFGRSELFASEGWILIDTNFKITAYTSSDLHVALLNKFAIITYQMPGFTSAYISPNSFRQALDDGTSLNDILNFLRVNLSPLGGGTIPANVEYQFHVWQKQRDRIQVWPNCVLRNIHVPEVAQKATEIARELMGFIAYFPGENGIALITTEEIEAEFAVRLRRAPM